MKKETVAVVPGSFDPMTVGHLSIVKKAMELYDKVVVAVMINDQKQYMFSLEEREMIARACVDGLQNVSVISSRGWLWELARDIGACAIVKGYRNDVDLEYEKKMASFNEEHYPLAKTVLLQADEALSEISSSALRDLILKGNSFAELMPQKAKELTEDILNKRKSNYKN